MRSSTYVRLQPIVEGRGELLDLPVHVTGDSRRGDHLLEHKVGAVVVPRILAR